MCEYWDSDYKGFIHEGYHLTILHKKGEPKQYIVSQQYPKEHFYSQVQLDHWINTRGLTVGPTIYEDDNITTSNLIGQFRVKAHMQIEMLPALFAFQTVVYENGWTPAYVEIHPEYYELHIMNPNYKDRIVLTSAEAQRILSR